MEEGAGSSHSPVSQMNNWRQRVKNETVSSKGWYDEWGFLAEPGSNPYRSKEVYDKEKRSQFNSTISSNLTDEARKALASEKQGSDSLDKFVRGYLKKTGGRDAKPDPQKEFQTPITTNMQYGWGRNLEAFGPLALRMR